MRAIGLAIGVVLLATAATCLARADQLAQATAKPPAHQYIAEKVDSQAYAVPTHVDLAELRAEALERRVRELELRLDEVVAQMNRLQATIGNKK